MSVLDGMAVVTLDLDDTLWDNTPTLQFAESTLYSWLQCHTPGITAHYTSDELKEHRKNYAERNPGLRHDLTKLRYESLCEVAFEFGYQKRDIEQAIQVFLKARNHVTLYADVIPALSVLSAKFPLVALTNGNADIYQTGISKYFILSISSADVGTSKPEPDMFHSVIRHFRVVPDRLVHIGDEPGTDILGAHRAGVNSIWINRSQLQWPEHLPRPMLEISSLLQLLPV